jgi:hypothetical protein
MTKRKDGEKGRMGATKRIREVRKRDSRIVPFDETKITDAIYAAIRSVGEGDRALAAELAAAVTHFLRKNSPGRFRESKISRTWWRPSSSRWGTLAWRKLTSFTVKSGQRSAERWRCVKCLPSPARA